MENMIARFFVIFVFFILGLPYSVLANGSSGIGSATVLADGIGFPEGTVLLRGALYFVDYQRSTVNRLTDSGYSVVARLPGCGANGLAIAKGAVLVACYDSGIVQEISFDGVRQKEFEKGAKGERFLHPNDLTTDMKGGVYFTASGDEVHLGNVFYLAPQSSAPVEVAKGIQNSNGIALSPDGHMLYVGESSTDRILCYAIASDGSLKGRAIFAELDSLAPTLQAFRHTPDGIRTDQSGNLYVALYNGGGLWILSDDGKLLHSVTLPGEHHSNVAIPQDGKILYVTAFSATSGQILSLRNPQSEGHL